MKFIFYVIILFFCTLASADPNPEAIRAVLQKQGYTEIPLIIIPHYKKLGVEISFLSHGNQLFLIDNGAMETTIHPDVVKKFGFKVEQLCIPVLGGGGNCLRYKKADIPKLQIDGFVSHNETAYFPTCSAPKLCQLQFAGILGSDFLSEHAGIIDLGNKKLFLKSDRENLTSEQHASFHQILINAGYKQIPIRQTESGLQILMAQIDNLEPKRFMIDTGSPFTLIALEIAKKHHLLGEIATVGKGSTGGQMIFYKTNVKNLTVDKITWSPKKPILATDYKDISAGNVSVFGTIGTDWMEDNAAILDMGDNTLFVK